MHWILTVPPDFSLKELIQRSHWMILPPFSINRTPESLERVERLSSGPVVSMTVNQVPAGLHIHVDLHLNAAQAEELSQKTWRMLRLGETFAPFLERARCDANLQTSIRQGLRFLRGADFFEDMLKALFFSETPTGDARHRLAQLVDGLGDPLPSNPTRHALPTATQLLLHDETTRQILGVERGATVLRAAIYYQHHASQLEDLLVTPPSLPDLLSQLDRIPGVEDNARAYLLLALGRYDCVPTAQNRLSPADREELEEWQPWSGLVYWLDRAPE